MPNKSGGGSDAADVTDYGIPCIDSIGVESNGIHTPKERASISSLKDSAKRLAVIINCF
jgi:acetylornithine deacetylase/succinyl-diaminopimelate desuccinylase-like protein